MVRCIKKFLSFKTKPILCFQWLLGSKGLKVQCADSAPLAAPYETFLKKVSATGSTNLIKTHANAKCNLHSATATSNAEIATEPYTEANEWLTHCLCTSNLYRTNYFTLNLLPLWSEIHRNRNYY